MAVLVFIFAVLLCVRADSATSPPDKACCDDPQSSPLLTRMRPVREGELLLLHDQMQQGDTLLKERLTSRFQHVQEQLKEGDAQLKEQLQDGDTRLKEEISQDEQWFKDRLTRVEDRVKEELSEGESRTTEELQEQKDVIKKLQDFVKEWAKRNDAVVTQQTQDLTDMRDKLQLAESKLQQALAGLKATQQSLEEEVEASKATKEQLEMAESEIQKLKAAANTLPETQQDSRPDPLRMQDDDFSPNLSAGSTFVRWGRTDCPDNTSLIYSGFVGGSHFEATGGASSQLCLVMEPQLDLNLTLPQHYTVIYGAEYDRIHGHHKQDVPCSVCLAPQSSTIMVPATLTCPPGWTPQYTGYLMASHPTHKRGTEYVCVDQDVEDVQGGHAEKNGHLIFYVATRCGSLPCPPYVHDKAVTCVVCSA